MNGTNYVHFNEVCGGARKVCNLAFRHTINYQPMAYQTSPRTPVCRRHRTEWFSEEDVNINCTHWYLGHQ